MSLSIFWIFSVERLVRSASDARLLPSCPPAVTLARLLPALAPQGASQGAEAGKAGSPLPPLARGTGSRGGAALAGVVPAPLAGVVPAPQAGGAPAPQAGGAPAPQAGGAPAPQAGGAPAPQAGGAPALLPHSEPLPCQALSLLQEAQVPVLKTHSHM